MPHCIHCGKKYEDGARFCADCGAALVMPQTIKQQQEMPDPVTQKPMVTASQKNNTKKILLWVIAGVVVLAGLATGAWFLYFKDKQSGNGDTVQHSSLMDTTNAQASNNRLNTHGTDSVPRKSNSSITPVSNSKLLQGGGALSTVDIEEISSIVKNFYEAEDNENVSVLLGYFAYPVERYYKMYNVDYDQLQSLFETSFSSKLLSHKMQLDWSNSRIENTAYGYDITVNGNYSFVTQKAPDEENSKNLSVIIRMNSNKEIISIYDTP